MLSQKGGSDTTYSAAQQMSQQAGVAENSLIVLHLAQGKISAEILPPATPEMKTSVRQISEKFREAFEEMKRLGD
jgi:hypothetical protein